MSKLWARKSIEALLAEAGESEHGLKRTLGSASLVALGIGAIIGAGLFVRTAAAASYAAGPSVTLGFVLAGVGCAFAGLCYAELSSMLPIAGSAYTYSPASQYGTDQPLTMGCPPFMATRSPGRPMTRLTSTSGTWRPGARAKAAGNA